MTTIDIDTCIGVQAEDEHPHDVATLLQEMDHYGVSQALCTHWAAIRYDAAQGNVELLEACQQQPRLHPIAVVNPAPYCGVREEIHRWAGRGVHGFRFLPARQGWSLQSEVFVRAWAALAETQLPGIVEVSASGEASQAAMATASLGAPLVLANIGYSTLGEAIAIMERFGHVWLEACRLVTPGVVETLVETLGSERLLFGSGATSWEIAPTLAMIQGADILATDRQAILADNARRLFGLGGDAS